MKKLKKYQDFSINESLFNWKKNSSCSDDNCSIDSDFDDYDNDYEIEHIVRKIGKENIKKPDYLEIKKIIMENDIKKIKVDNKYHKSFKFLTNNDNIIEISGFYVNNYGDTSDIDGVYSYYISCPNYDNTKDIKKLKKVLDEESLSSSIFFLRKNKNRMIITSEEFNILYKILKNKYKTFKKYIKNLKDF